MMWIERNYLIMQLYWDIYFHPTEALHQRNLLGAYGR